MVWLYYDYDITVLFLYLLIRPHSLCAIHDSIMTTFMMTVWIEHP